MGINASSGNGQGYPPKASVTRGPWGFDKLPVTPFDPRTGKYLPFGSANGSSNGSSGSDGYVMKAVVTGEEKSGVYCNIDGGDNAFVNKPQELIGLEGDQIEPPYEVNSIIYIGKLGGESGDEYVDLNLDGRHPSRRIKCFNDDDDDIPAGSVAEVTDVDVDDDVLYYKVEKPSGDNLLQIVIIPEGVKSGDLGSCIAPTEENISTGVIIDDPPDVGEEVGTVEDSWRLSGDGTGFIFLGEYAVEGGDSLSVIRPNGGSAVLLYRAVSDESSGKIDVKAVNSSGATVGDSIEMLVIE